jgi:YesN/AraC family two-component response regulator
LSLLITDVVMPKMNGIELYQALRERRPALKVLYVSGYSAHVMGGTLAQGVHFLEKPFTQQALALKVRAALEKD